MFESRSSHWEAFLQNSFPEMLLFFHLSKPCEMPVSDLILLVYLLVPPVCNFTKRGTPYVR